MASPCQSEQETPNATPPCPQELKEKCHPLGVFDNMERLAVAANMTELYDLVLRDTPLGPYFSASLSSEDLDEMNLEILRNTLYKAYLDDFAKFCHEVGGATAEIMDKMMQFEARPSIFARVLRVLCCRGCSSRRAYPGPSCALHGLCRRWRHAAHGAPLHPRACCMGCAIDGNVQLMESRCVRKCAMDSTIHSSRASSHNAQSPSKRPVACLLSGGVVLHCEAA